MWISNGAEKMGTRVWLLGHEKQGVDLVVPGPEQPLVDGAEVVFRKGKSQTPPNCCPKPWRYR